MKVLFMSNIPSPYRVDFFNELGKWCDLTVTFEGHSATDRNEKWKAGCERNFHEVYMRGIRVTNDAFFCPEIIRVLKQSWDKIIVGVYSTPTSMLAIEYLRRKKIKFGIEADGGLIKEDRYFIYLMKRHFISAAAYWLSSGNLTTEYLVHYGASRERCYWYPFTSIREKEIVDERKEDSKARERYTVLYVGQLIQRKGVDILIKAAKYLDKNVIIDIVGGRPEEEYTELVKTNDGAETVFVDFMPKEKLKNYYESADVFVLPTRQDIWGLVINEAMAHGLPVITTTRCVAGMELVENGKNGYLISGDDEKELAERIKEIISDRRKISSFGKASLEKIQQYTIEKMARRHMEILEQV